MCKLLKALLPPLTVEVEFDAVDVAAWLTVEVAA